MRAAAIVVALLGTGSLAHADPAGDDFPDKAWAAGLNLRSDYGAHRVRVTAAAHFGRLAATVVLDPKVLFDTKQNDVDVLTEWSVSSSWAALGGYRLTQVSIDRGVQFSHELLIGASGELPPILGGQIRNRFGVEIEVSIVRHGDGLETNWFSIESDRHFRDLLSLNLFLRSEYVSVL